MSHTARWFLGAVLAGCGAMSASAQQSPDSPSPARSATVTAATDLVCYGLTFWEFRPLIERNGTIGWKLLQALAKRLRAADPS